MGPYVPAIDDAGRVVFWLGSASKPGNNKILIHQDSSITSLSAPGAGSHPVFKNDHTIAYYQFEQGLICQNIEEKPSLLISDKYIGPLGPTVTSSQEILLRSTSRTHDCVYLAGDDLITIAKHLQSSARITGLPVAGNAGEVFVRLEHSNGLSSLLKFEQGELVELFSTPDNLSSFPGVLLNGKVVLVLNSNQESKLIEISSSGLVKEHYSSGRKLHGILGFSINQMIVFRITEARGMEILLFNGRQLRRLTGSGSVFDGRIIQDFAMNQVSLNRHRDFALRVGYEDGSGQIWSSNWDKAWAHAEDLD